MSEPQEQDRRETIWGINPGDRKWFQLMTLMGGTTGSVILTHLEMAYHAGTDTPDEAARNIILGIGASFVASGFTAWGMLQAKELMMAIADWIREKTARDREKRNREMIQQAYRQGYQDAREGRPERPPGPGREKDQDGE